MKTPLLDGIQKEAILDILGPAAYGYYAKSMGRPISKSLTRGALIGAAINTLSSAGDLLSGKTDTQTITKPISGLIRGGISGVGGYALLPMLFGKLKGLKVKDWSKKVLETGKDTLKRLDEAAEAAGV